PLHSSYVRRYALYRAMPTRFRPPLPAEYPCVTVQITAMGRVTHDFANDYLPQEFEASIDRLMVRIGPNTVEALADGAVRVRAQVSGHHAVVAADVIFRGETVEGELRLGDDTHPSFVGRGSREHIVSTRSIISPRLFWSSLVPN